MEETNGPYWRSKADYLLVCVCLSTNVSSVFTFALYTINYGAAFVLSYLVIVCSFGIPLIHFELMQGQFSGRGVLGIYDAFPISRGAPDSLECRRVRDFWFVQARRLDTKLAVQVMYVVLIAPKVLLMLILIHGSSLHGPSEEGIAFPPLRWSNLWDVN
ncbi:hypothetical protein HPB47_019559, partial [Ixodes persulcatus]